MYIRSCSIFSENVFVTYIHAFNEADQVSCLKQKKILTDITTYIIHTWNRFENGFPIFKLFSFGGTYNLNMSSLRTDLIKINITLIHALVNFFSSCSDA